VKFCCIRHWVTYNRACNNDRAQEAALFSSSRSRGSVVLDRTLEEKSGVSSLMEYINGKANGRQTRASARRSIDGVIELICQFANYTDEFVWWPPPRGRVSLFIDRERIGGWLLAVVSRACAWNRGVRRTCVRACVRACVHACALPRANA